MARRALIAAALAVTLSAGSAIASVPAKALVPIPSALETLMRARDTSASAPILMRAFKKEAEIEVWKLARNGRYVHLKTYPICRWSGQLGPKQKTGDRQTPEGFYAVPAAKMNPNSSYHLSFDVGYPNAYDRAHGGTGSYLMVHGTCSSMGCFAMTDAQISEIYALAREAFAGGQRAFQFQSYPFRMTAQNMARARLETHIGFWRQLKDGYDRFEATGEEVAWSVAGGRYAFAPSKRPEREELAQTRIARERDAVAALVADGSAATRVTYLDGGMHASFASLSRRGVDVGPISRPETLAAAGRELILLAARPKPKPVVVASAAVAKPSLRLGAASGGWPEMFAPVALASVGPSEQPATAAMAGSARILPASLSPRNAVVAQRGA